jgi:hypothetical protein
MTVRRLARGAKPAGSFDVALNRAVDFWDRLTGGPQCREPGTLLAGGRMVYSDAAAAGIVGLALGLWSDSAAQLSE